MNNRLNEPAYLQHKAAYTLKLLKVFRSFRRGACGHPEQRVFERADAVRAAVRDRLAPADDGVADDTRPALARLRIRVACAKPGKNVPRSRARRFHGSAVRDVTTL